MLKKNNTAYNNFLGFSLIELSIALLMSAVLLAGAIKLYISYQSSLQTQIALATIQNNQRIASYFLEKAIHMAGFTGCSHRSLDNAFQGLKSTNTKLPKEVKGNTDAFQVKFAEQPLFDVKKIKSLNALLINKNNTLEVGDEVVLTDCLVTQVLQIINIYFQGDIEEIKFNKIINKNIELPSTLARLQEYIFYIAESEEKSKLGHRISMLEVKDIKQRNTELVDGVSNMKITYFSQKNSEEIKSTASEKKFSIKNWEDVNFLKINLLFNSIQQIKTFNHTYFFNGRNYNNDNKLLYKAFPLDVSLRQRLQ